MPSNRILLIIINHNHHPHTNLPVVRQQRRTMDPTVPALITTELRNPLDARSDTASGHHSVENMITLSTRVADAVQEGGLEHSGDLEGGRSKENAKGGIGADEEVLALSALILSR